MTFNVAKEFDDLVDAVNAADPKRERGAFEKRDECLRLLEQKIRADSTTPQAAPPMLGYKAFLQTCAGPAFTREDIRQEATLMLARSEPQRDAE